MDATTWDRAAVEQALLAAWALYPDDPGWLGVDPSDLTPPARDVWAWLVDAWAEGAHPHPEHLPATHRTWHAAVRAALDAWGAVVADPQPIRDALAALRRRERVTTAAQAVLAAAATGGDPWEVWQAQHAALAEGLMLPGLQRAAAVIDAHAERRQTAAPGHGWRLRTGWPSLDALLLDGFEPGTLTLLAARPSVGKTTVAQHWLAAWAARGIPAVLFSLEMSADQVATHWLVHLGAGDAAHVHAHPPTSRTPAYQAAAQRARTWPHWLWAGAATLAQVGHGGTQAGRWHGSRAGGLG